MTKFKLSVTNSVLNLPEKLIFYAEKGVLRLRIKLFLSLLEAVGVSSPTRRGIHFIKCMVQMS